LKDLVEPDKRDEENYLVFEAGGFPLAVRISQVRRVFDKSSLDPAVETFDLAKMLNMNLKAGGYGVEISIKDKTAAVPVDRVEPIKDLRLALWLKFPQIMRRKNNRMIEGFFFDGFRMISLINFEQAGV